MCSQVKRSLPGVDITRPLDPSRTAAITTAAAARVGLLIIIIVIVIFCNLLNRGDDLTARSTLTSFSLQRLDARGSDAVVIPRVAPGLALRLRRPPLGADLRAQRRGHRRQ